MKAQEKDTDRKAEVNLHVTGQIKALIEYGQYEDPVDKALCCYVAVAEGDIPKIRGRCSGTTMTIVYDVSIDGVLRKAQAYLGKAVSRQLNKKLDCETFMYQNKENEFLDTEMRVLISDIEATKADGPETIGTIEICVFMLRKFGEEYDTDKAVKYYSKTLVNFEDNADVPAPPTYKMMAPDFKMGFEENCAILDNRTANRQKKHMDMKRPGDEPWAIFRFHYRSQESIDSKALEKTYDPSVKDTKEAHVLKLEAVPELEIGALPNKGDFGGASSAASTPGPQTTSSPFVMKLPARLPIPKPTGTELQNTPERSRSPDGQHPTGEQTNRASEIATIPQEVISNENTAPPPKKRPAPTTSTVPSKRPAPPPTPATRLLAETRKQLRDARLKREKIAANQSKVDEKLAPYHARVAAEVEKLKVELAEEERQRLLDDIKMLRDFEATDYVIG